MLPNNKDREGKLSLFCMIKDMQTWVLIEKTAFPMNAENNQIITLTGFRRACLVFTNEKSTKLLRLMISAEYNISVQILKTMGEE